ncbi:MAG TPA: DUF418 domain-containing protein [Vicinamibacterales bacterium]|nr:DUF418 domain-containing protein [Vicinamibacterales bacterium]
MTQLAPVTASERLETLDVLRGFALLGILAMNVRAMAAPFSAYMYPYALFDYTGASRAAYMFTSIVFDLKMMGLFSMLFGAGVLLYAAKPTATGKPPRGLWFKRMFWLLVIGLVHAYLIWDGDILVPYALCGIILLWWVRRLPAWALMAGAAGLLAIGALMSIGHGFAFQSMEEAQRAQELQMWMPTREQAGAQLARLHGGYFEIVAYRAPFVFMGETFFFLMFFLWRCGGMMLLGMALHKMGFLDGSRPDRVYTLAASVCIPAGLALAAYGVVELERVRFGMPDRTALDLWNYAGAVLASVGYAAALILLVKRGVLGPIRSALAAVGQMAFSNYLLQSVIASIVFLGWGFGLAGRLDYAQQLLFVAAVWALQLAVSPVWLRQYRFGPAEWLWRSLTYWRLQPMRRDTPQSPRLGGVAAGV